MYSDWGLIDILDISASIYTTYSASFEVKEWFSITNQLSPGLELGELVLSLYCKSVLIPRYFCSVPSLILQPNSCPCWQHILPVSIKVCLAQCFAAGTGVDFWHCTSHWASLWGSWNTGYLESRSQSAWQCDWMEPYSGGSFSLEPVAWLWVWLDWMEVTSSIVLTCSLPLF
jgi:hypothetical protein